MTTSAVEAPGDDVASRAVPSPPPSSDGAVAPLSDGVVDMQTATIAGKKKRKPKGFTARGPTALPKNRGSGFEEFYAEPPLTVGEYEEEMDLYHARIETCIQRYRARRRLDNDRTNLFNRYLSIGGIDCAPRQFNGGAGMQETEGMTNADKRNMTATDVVPQGGSKVSKYYASDNDHLWTVDFAGVVSGFLSVSLRSIGSCREKLMVVGIDVVDNFLRYLQIHDTCPEYDENIKEARAICTKAQTELPNCLHAVSLMPGEFNLACAKLFCKEPEHMNYHDGLDPLESLPSKDWDAENVFRTTVLLQDKIVGPKAIAMVKEGTISSIRIVATKEVDLEITRLVLPSEALCKQYAASGVETESSNTSEKEAVAEAEAVDAAEKPAGPSLQPSGIVICKYCCIEEGFANQPHPTSAELAQRGKEAFFLDAKVMDMLVVGMKMRVVMHELNCDLNFVSAVKELLPSFYTFLPQELMIDFREPKPNEREAPSVDNPDIEDEVDAEADMMKDD